VHRLREEDAVNVPFRIGATSFIYPARWLSNVERLAGRVDDIEILLFELECGVPDEAELRALVEWKGRAELTYTVHTPLNVSLASDRESQRQRAIEQVCRAIELARPLRPHAYIVHVYLGDCEHDREPSDLPAWRRRAAGSLEAILDSGISPADVCVETLDYDFSHIEPVVDDLGLSVAIDLGHLHRDARPEQEFLLRNLHRTRVIQWHGVDPSGRDHRSLKYYPPERARWVIDTLLRTSYRGVLTLEVFCEADFEESLAVVRSLLAEERS
jgi:sugar phosphate isomerase/epimerase